MTRQHTKRPPAPVPTQTQPAAEVRVLSPRRKFLFPLLILLLWCGFFGSIEGALRLAGYGYDTSLFLDVEGGIRIDNPETTIRYFPAADNPDPARPSNLFLVEKSPGSFRVFVVGESTAQGFPYQRGHSFAQIAGEALGAQGIGVEVINLGNSALSSYYVREVLGDIARYSPDLVVVYAGHNEYYGSPSNFTGGTHLTRLATLKLRKLRSFQLLEAGVIRMTGRDAAEGTTLMEQRFAEFLHPLDEAKDEVVANLFLNNLKRGAAPLLRDQIPILVFEPVSNLVSMPPFRSAPEGAGVSVAGSSSALALYRDRMADLESGGAWDRARWEEIKDLDHAPFRARSVLVRKLEEYVSAEPSMHWIPTADEMEQRVGRRAFTDDFFIDHLHLNFEGQTLLASILAEAMAEALLPDRPDIVPGIREFFTESHRVRQAVHFTDFWEFRAYSIIVALQQEEPFRSMPISKAPPLTRERILANPLYADTTLLTLYRGAVEGEDLFQTTVEYYYLSGNREEWIRNMNAYVYLFPGHFASHLAYGIAVLSDDPGRNVEMAASYFRQAFLLSQKSAEIRDVIRSEFSRLGIGPLWPAFEIQYLR